MATRWWTRSVAGVLAVAGALLALAGVAHSSSTPETDIVQTGTFVLGLEPYDRLVAKVMREHRVPGAAVAIVRDGRLVYARGFGMADRLHEVPVQPDSLFRIASLSKPITAAAVLKLVEDGRLKLGDRVFRDLLAGVGPHPPTDARMNEITVQDLLRHSGGFDRYRSGHVLWQQKKVSRKVGKRPPIECADAVSYMKERRLDFDPGERYVYSNFGYCALGRVVEHVSGIPYEDYVRKEVLIPAGAHGIRLADPFLEGRRENEVRYYDHPGASRTKSFDPAVRKRVSRPYSGYLLPMHAAGAWAASAVDFIRFVLAVDGRGGDDILAEETIALMLERPPYARDPYWYGLGWMVRDLGGGQSNWWHNGAFPGNTGIVVRAANGLSWVVLTNSWSKSWYSLVESLDAAMWEAFGQVTTWPDHDLFPAF